MAEDLRFGAQDKASRYRELLPQLQALFDELAAFDDLDDAGLAPIATLLGTLAW
jgi:hypothetical protein